MYYQSRNQNHLVIIFYVGNKLFYDLSSLIISSLLLLSYWHCYLYYIKIYKAIYISI